MPGVLLIDAAGQLLALAVMKLAGLAGAAAFGLAWLATATMGFLYASIFARGFVILAVGHAIWLAAGVAYDRLAWRERRAALADRLGAVAYDVLTALPR